ncbi:MAG: anhydro-N-acetylmuramic acid kinase, partial [Gammaproteobacteria bacterium]
IGNPAVIAAGTGIDVVADFRRADIDAGGQGAPLVPAFHQALFARAGEHRVVLNIGGIANITILPSDASLPVTGFDTGPGNTLLDAWTRQHLDAPMDTGGRWAAQGSVHAELLAGMLQDPYFHAPPPKSTGREYFNPDWLARYLQDSGIAAQDVQATLCALTAQSILDALEHHAPRTQRLLVCGGGIHNPELLRRLAENQAGMPVESTQPYGVDPDWVEAVAFAWLAKQHLDGKPGNIPAVTGAQRPVVLGSRTRASRQIP